MIFLLLTVAIVLVVAHEGAHVATTLACGGRFVGIAVKPGLAVGVIIRVDALSPRQIAGTFLAAPMAEVLVIGAALLIRPEAWSLWLLLLGVQWAANWIPWPWFPTDGRKFWLVIQGGRAALLSTNAQKTDAS